MTRPLLARGLFFFAALVLALAAPAQPARSTDTQAPRAVIELFTSQGCSSCPPADEQLIELARNPDLVALTLHVDYWDYLGWEDTLARAEFSERQRDYSDQRGDRGVFTPQMVINGLYSCIGSDPNAVDASLATATRDTPRLPVPVRLDREGRDLTITLPANQSGKAGIWLLTVEPEVTVAIERGENRGREARYVNVVRAIMHLADWDGSPSQLQTRLPDDTGRFVVLIQRRDADRPGRILGAARGDGIPVRTE